MTKISKSGVLHLHRLANHKRWELYYLNVYISHPFSPHFIIIFSAFSHFLKLIPNLQTPEGTLNETKRQIRECERDIHSFSVLTSV